MSWTTAIADLRQMLSDGPTDKIVFRKPILGIPNGVNLVFKTFDRRRVTNLTAPTGIEGFFVNDVAKTVSSDDPDSGQFVASVAPVEGDRVTASYYFQWFDDIQLGVYLKNASFFFGFGNDYTQIGEFFQPAALQYAMADAYKELSVRFARMLSEGFRMEDLPNEALEKSQKSYQGLSEAARKEALMLRKYVYTRQDQNEAPLFATQSGNARTVEPNS